MDGIQILLSDSVKYLGVTLDDRNSSLQEADDMRTLSQLHVDACRPELASTE